MIDHTHSEAVESFRTSIDDRMKRLYGITTEEAAREPFVPLAADRLIVPAPLRLDQFAPPRARTACGIDEWTRLVSTVPGNRYRHGRAGSLPAPPGPDRPGLPMIALFCPMGNLASREIPNVNDK
jgi:hypothetical protein